MPKLVFVWLAAAAGLHAEVYTLTLRQAVEKALTQNTDIALAHLEERKAIEAVRIAKDPFTPRITVGSGLAYSSGFPMSIEGGSPSVVQARATQFLFNRQQSYAVAQAKEEAHGATIGIAAKRDEVVYRVTSLYLDAERAGRIAELARKEVESLQKIARTVQTQEQEGRVLPLEVKRAAYNVARARQIADSMADDQVSAENNLALVLGYEPQDLVRPLAEERTPPPLPESEDAAIRAAFESSKELQRLQSQMLVKELERRGEKAARLPRVDLVAQYGLFAKFNHYEDYFRRFERHNGQLGISFQIPVLTGPGVAAMTSQTETEIAHLRLEMSQVRRRIGLEIRQGFREIRKADAAREVARLDLEVAREQLSVLLAQMQEGRAGLQQVEAARGVESDKWIAFYDAQYAAERARWSLARQTGELLAALR